MAHRLLHDPEKDGWERSDFPIVCETCLGPNPYVRMQRMEYGAECHISKRPYTKFRWRPGSDARYKSTIICQEVAKAKNVCQVCLLDLKHNLPVQVRDQMTNAVVEDIPESEVGLEYQLALKQSRGELGAQFQDKELAENDNLARLTRTTPYYKRNRAQLCSFFARGECKRGAECPYRHEMPQTGELAEQNIRDRYYGINDPVAKKMMRRLGERTTLEPPADTSICTLFIGNVEPNWKEGDLRPIFEAHGDVTSVRVVHSKSCAFVTYATRKDAETAAEKLHDALIINGSRCKLLWGKPQGQRPGQAPPGALPPGAQASTSGAGPPDFFGMGAVAAYPSMDPNLLGSSGAPHGAPGAAPPGPHARPPMGMPPPMMPMGPAMGGAPPPFGFAGPPPGMAMGPPPGMVHPGMAPPGYMFVQPSPGTAGPPPAMGTARPAPPQQAPQAAAAPVAAPPQEAAAQ